MIETMTIQELKEKKQALEKEIADKLQRFEEETELPISGMSYIVKDLNYKGFAFPVKDKSCEVKIEVKL